MLTAKRNIVIISLISCILPIQILYTQDTFDAQEYKNLLIKSPLKAFIKTCRYQQPSYKKYKMAHPLAYLSECADRHCPLTRCDKYDTTKETKFRREFEKMCVKKLLNIAKGKNIIHYASFGSGQLFQDLVILTKFLEHAPKNVYLTISLIDTIYTVYTQTCDNLNNTRLAGSTISSPVCEKELISQLKEKNEGQEEFLKLSAQDQFTTLKIMFKNFTNLLNKNFPKQILYINTFTTAQDYISHIKRKVASRPNIIVSADTIKRFPKSNKKENKLLTDYKSCIKSCNTEGCALIFNKKKHIPQLLTHNKNEQGMLIKNYIDL